MSTGTAILLEDTATTGSFMLPGMGSPEEASCSRVVRFHNECVLIPKTSPTRSKMPVVLTKSYSLPLWKRKTSQFSDSDVEDTAGSSVQPQSPEDKRVTIKVPIPTFRRSSRSPTPKARSASSSPITPKSLPSCLVYRAPSALASRSEFVKPIPIRRPSLPIYHRRQDELTVPLRDCCADCQRITEECLKEGNDWKEKFSRGARRRRSSSLGNSTPSSSDTRHANITKAFTPFTSEGSAGKDPTSKFGTTAAAFSITVDEVDRRRKVFDYSMEDTDFIRSLSPPPSPSSSQLFHSSASPFASSSGSSLYPRVKSRDREVSSSSTLSLVSPTDELFPGPDTLDSRNRLRSSPIEEEDETQLFPLPRRSRSNTPSPSPSPKVSPPPSPNPNESSSSLSLMIPPSPYIASKWNSSSSQESILPSSLSRDFENEHLAVPSGNMARSWAISATSTLSSSPSLSLKLQPKHTGPTTRERAPTRLVSPKGPLPLSISKAEPSDTENKPSSSATPSIPPSANTPHEIPDQNTALFLAPPSSNSPSTDHINNIPSSNIPKPEIAITLPEQVNNSSKIPPSAFSNHTPSPIDKKPQRKRRLSFTLPFIKAGGAIRDVGADVLKGVSSISNSGVVGSF